MCQVLSIYLNVETELGSVAKKLIYIVCLLVIGGSLFAQTLEPIVTLSQDSVMLGEEFEVSVTIKYPKKRQVLFPDSTHFFGTFELAKKVYSTTTSNDSISIDSAVYTFTTFDLSSPQKLAIPVFIVTATDSIEVVSDSLSIFIKEVIGELPDEIEIKGNTDYQEVEYEFNKEPWFYVIGGLILLVIISVLVFGKRVVRFFQKKAIIKSHNKFKSEFAGMVNSINSDNTNVESVVALWKNHLTRLSKDPFNTYSTSEIFEVTKNEQLKNDLRVFDKSIYSSQKLNSIDQLTESLLKFSDVKFEERVKQLSNGK